MMDNVNLECPACAHRNSIKRNVNINGGVSAYMGSCENCGVMLSVAVADLKKTAGTILENLLTGEPKDE